MVLVEFLLCCMLACVFYFSTPAMVQTTAVQPTPFSTPVPPKTGNNRRAGLPPAALGGIIIGAIVVVIFGVGIPALLCYCCCTGCGKRKGEDSETGRADGLQTDVVKGKSVSSEESFSKDENGIIKVAGNVSYKLIAVTTLASFDPSSEGENKHRTPGKEAAKKDLNRERAVPPRPKPRVNKRSGEIGKRESKSPTRNPQQPNTKGHVAPVAHSKPASSDTRNTPSTKTASAGAQPSSSIKALSTASDKTATKPTGGGKAKPPQPTGGGKAKSPQHTGGGPQPTGGGKAKPPQPTGGGKAKPPQTRTGNIGSFY